VIDLKALKIVKPPGNQRSLSLLGTPWVFAYRYIGTRVERLLPQFKDRTDVIQKAALKLSLPSYVSLLVLFSAVSGLASILVTSIVVAIYGAPILMAAIYGLGLCLLLGAGIFGILYLAPSLMASSRKKKMDLELPFVASHMSILAASGIPPTRMFKLLEDSRTTPETASDSNEIVRDVEVLGKDIMTALEAERERSPSNSFGELLEGLVATIRSGGDMKNYLLDATRTIMDLRRIAAKQLIETLAAFGEIYVTLMIVFPLLVIVMFSVMALIGGGIGGLSVTTMMIFTTYAIIPLCGGAIIVMLDNLLVAD
jgi:flagellar protein FlaJ